MPRPLLSLITSCALLSVLPAAAAGPGAATQRLHQLIEKSWAMDMADSPLSATYYGEKGFNDRWPDISPTAMARGHQQDQDLLAQLSRIDSKQLPASERVNHALFKKSLESRLALWPHQPWAYEMTARDGPQALNEVAENMPFDTVADYETWLKRLDTLPAYLDQYMDRLRAATKTGRTQPRMLMARVLPQLQGQPVARTEDSPFYTRFKSFPDKFPAAERERLSRQAAQVIQNKVLPAYARMEVFFRTEYLPACRESVGIWDTPGGPAYYANRVAEHTTTTLTPDEIHQIGLREVARIHGEMRKVMEQVGFTGARQQFFEKLRTDPQFYYATPEELFNAYVVVAKSIEPELPKLFGKLPRTPFGVRAIPMTSAPNTTAAYYSGPSVDGTRAGYFYVNLHRPEMRPKYEMEVLASHEAVPGHHLQIALAQEQAELPKFRRFASYSAFLEGWALYGEALGYELGLYKDPYSRFGQLTYDMWRAVRLVVDTGIHSQRWTREQAIDYFRDNAAKTETDIVNEVDRYIGWPGQALAYKIGQLRIMALRAQAEQALGSGFDVRAFHDALLAQGALPLDVLEQQVRAWVQGRLKRKR